MSYFLTDFLHHLNIVELYRLKLTCKQYNQSITKDMLDKLVISKITARFQDKIFDLEIQTFIKQYNCFISGSSIIQSILDEHYDDSDIDIYVPIAHKNLIKVNQFKNFQITNDTNRHYRSLSSGDIKICRVVDYQSDKGNKIQLIYVKIKNNRQSIIDYLAGFFDFDICKNFYRFNDIYIKNLYQILNKELHFKLDNDLWNINKTLGRINKYQSRGFKLINHCSLEQLSQEKVLIYHVELIKYRIYRVV
jgi:hypothetical protein